MSDFKKGDTCFLDSAEGTVLKVYTSRGRARVSAVTNARPAQQYVFEQHKDGEYNGVGQYAPHRLFTVSAYAKYALAHNMYKSMNMLNARDLMKLSMQELLALEKAMEPLTRKKKS